MINEQTYNAQVEFCKENEIQCLVPNDGKCEKCGKDIFKVYAGSAGVDYRTACTKQIKRCPHCKELFRKRCDYD